MDKRQATEKANEALAKGDAELALKIATEAESEGAESAELHYLRGKAHMRRSDWRQAINAFLSAERLDAASPARECRLMLEDILAFRNKDLYNQ